MYFNSLCCHFFFQGKSEVLFFSQGANADKSSSDGGKFEVTFSELPCKFFGCILLVQVHKYIGLSFSIIVFVD